MGRAVILGERQLDSQADLTKRGVEAVERPVEAVRAELPGRVRDGFEPVLGQ